MLVGRTPISANF